MAPAALGAAAVAGTAAIAALDPDDAGASICLSQSLFGLDCPLCGGLRCVNALARADLAAAADHNVVLAVLLPLAAIALVVWFVTALRGRTLRIPNPTRGAWVAVGIALAVFTLLRNVGGDGWVGWLASGATG